MIGTCIVHPDDRERYKRGAPFTFYDGVRTVTGTVVRRRAQRDGSVKLWLKVGEIVAGNNETPGPIPRGDQAGRTSAPGEGARSDV
jgi:hypothetical protein